MRDHKAVPDVKYELSLPSIGKQALIIKKDVGGQHANPMKTWNNMGKPRSLNKDQLEILKASAEPLQTDAKLYEKNGNYEVEVTISCNHLCMLEITHVDDMTSTYLGYDPDEFYGME